MEGILNETSENRVISKGSENITWERILREIFATANHSRQRTKYIVYECSKARGMHCSGWSDRIAGIMTTYIISILTKRHFLIHFDTPCFLTDYIMPAHFDWRYNSSILQHRTSSFHYYKNLNHKKIAKYMFQGDDFDTYFKHDVIFILMNWDFIADFRKRPNIGHDIPWITQYHQSDIYKHLYNFFFKLSPVSDRALNHFIRTQRKRKKIACAHIRHGRNSNMPNDIKRGQLPLQALWKLFDTLDKNEYDLFVASDTNNVKIFAKERYPENMIDTPGEITHIDQSGMNDEREGFLKQILDFHILTRCDVLIISGNGGFGMLAAFIRNIDYGLYCWKGESMIPCSRYTVTDIFPSGKFGKKPMNLWQ
ncbi:uncharacterized protein LOC132547112 [Ylistrum balloti]|uniref:uncharacterized protein LOC132547112 n=1 Tax=Ylistrum balloti TaxID=509963 RepID=UPI002905CC9F|nr:uncharacterized protein LOC132547112 [Ylistrum balloti]